MALWMVVKKAVVTVASTVVLMAAYWVGQMAAMKVESLVDSLAAHSAAKMVDWWEWLTVA